MRKTLSNTFLNQYERDGVMFPVPVLDAEEVGYFRGSLEAMERILGGKIQRMDQCHLFYRWAFELVSHPRVLDVMEDLLGPDLFVHSSRIFYKHPKDPSFVSWHQDGIYSDLNSKPAPSAWIALSDSSTENGCLRVIPGTHHQTAQPHTETYGENNLLNHGEVIDLEIDERLARDVELQAGEMSLHHVNTIHGSKANTSDRPRIGFAISYMAPAVKRSHLPVIRMRGSSSAHEFELIGGPPADRNLEASVAVHKEFLKARGIKGPRVVS